MRSPVFLLYEDKPGTDLWLKILLGGILVMFLVLGGVLLFQDEADAFEMFGIAVFYALLFKIVMPQRYQIYSDKIRIVFGGPLAWNIPFSTIKEVRFASGAKAFAYSGVRFATSFKNVVEIRRSRGCSVVISPSNKDVFLEQASRAMKSAGHG
jgi:Bacterial PH domain